MKLTKDQEIKLTEMAFAEKSNKEIAEELGIELKDVHAARSKLGITIPKVKEMKTVKRFVLKEPRAAEEIEAEIAKVLKAKAAANKKLERCDERLAYLTEELQLNKSGGR